MKDCEILLIEDNQDDIELTRLAFDEADLCENITVMKDGEEALDYLFQKGKFVERQNGNLPSLILLDLNMPKMSGLDVLKHIRDDEHTSLLPVIVLTSSQEDQDIISSYRLGANAYVRKPVDYSQFVEAAKTLGLFWLVLNEKPPRKALSRKEA